MNKEVVSAKLESLRRCVQRVKDKTPLSSSELMENHDLQDIISLNLERAVQICVDLAAHIISESNLQAPGSMAESFETLHSQGVLSDELTLRMKKAVGFRNIAVHAYQEINWEMVYSILTTRLVDFVEFARAVSRTAGLI
ncbi:MAG: DUF86 domain-containing protein [Acidobacteriota bacterium]|nr:DUF86 domain-containing protein [Acidobacteriota bacterium]